MGAAKQQQIRDHEREMAATCRECDRHPTLTLLDRYHCECGTFLYLCEKCGTPTNEGPNCDECFKDAVAKDNT